MITAESYTDDLDTAGEFLAHLRPSADHWDTPITAKLRWVFRGQRDAAWRLLPSAWRDSESARKEVHLLSNTLGAEGLVDFSYLLDRCRIYVPGPIADVNEQSELELRMLQEFIAHANTAAIPFPHSSVEINVPDFGFVARSSDISETCCSGFEHRANPFFDHVLETQFSALTKREVAGLLDKICKLFRKTGKRWPYITNFTMRNSVAALAQHHGIPTRLLDWSQDSRKAAFFAGTGVSEDQLESDEKRIAVFAINPFHLKNRCLSEDLLLEHLNDPKAVELFLSSHGFFIEKTDTTSYLAAQEGLFTYPKYADLFKIMTGEYPTLDDNIERLIDWQKKDEHKPNIRNYIRKITLPYSEVDELMALLDGERIMLTTMMPNLDNFKECMLSRSERQQRMDKRKSKSTKQTAQKS